MKVATAIVAVALVLATSVTANQPFECNSIHGDNEVCTREFNPVCGSDGVTYSNLCRLRNAACKLSDGRMSFTEGACAANFACPTVCPQIYEPICGTDGVTYASLCNLIARRCEMFRSEATIDTAVALVTRAHDGECAAAAPACDEACMDSYEPVCGTNGQTYANACELRRFACMTRTPNVDVEFEGSCEECPDMCTEEYTPVCASNGQTFGNVCAFKMARCAAIAANGPALRLMHAGECPVADQPAGCDEACATAYEPVCGSDGSTYANTCELNRHNCVARSSVTVVSAGPCQPVVAPCAELCPMSYEPVCGSDGVTYGNECELTRHNCLARTSVAIVAAGSCQPVPDACAEVCPMSYEPVCGSDGNTYSNECELTRQGCLARTTITVAAQGECVTNNCAEACPMSYEPVCGSDGNTYGNECELTRQSCLARKIITVAKKGRCEEEAVPCNNACEKKVDPVCGSDGATYPNLCLLELAACKARSDLKAVSKGACPREPEVPTTDACAENACSMNEACIPEPKQCFTEPCPQYRCAQIGGDACADMVCGNNADCVSEPSGNKPFTCVPRPVESCDTMCTFVYQPVCGSDMRIYSNACELKQASCRRKMNGQSTISQVDMAECVCDCNDSVMRLPWNKVSPSGKAVTYSQFADVAFGAGATPEQVTSMFALMDTNGDNVISEAEYNEFVLVHAAQADSDAPDAGQSPTSAGQIAVIVVAAVVGVALISAIAVVAVRRRRARNADNSEPLLREDSA